MGAMRFRSKLRRRIWIAALLIMAGGAAYAYFTRSQALRDRLVKGLNEINLSVASLDTISFSPWRGLRIQGLVVTAEPSALDASSAPPLVKIPYARVSIDPWLLLIGGFRPREVLLEDPAVTLVWSEAETERTEPRGVSGIPTISSPPAWAPRIRVDGARLRIVALEHGRYVTRREYAVEGWGRFVPGVSPTASEDYELRLFMTAGSKQNAGATMAQVRWSGRRLTAQFGRLDLVREQILFPTPLARLCRELRLKGDVRVTEAALDSRGVARVVLQGDGLGCLLPIETNVQDPSQDRFAGLADVCATLTFDRADKSDDEAPYGLHGSVVAKLEGRLNDAAVVVDMSVTEFAVQPDTTELSVADNEDSILPAIRFGPSHTEITLEGLTLPNLQDNADFVTSEQLPSSLRSWIRKYDASGRVNLHISLDDDGMGDGVRFEGRLETLDGACRYYGFPYRISDARGGVRFSNDGVFFEGLRGRHGASRIQLDGRLLNSKSWTGFDLVFHGRNIVTDADLYTALPTRYQALWRQAAPIGLWDVEVRLHRDDGSEETGSCPTDVRVDARLLAGSLRLGEDRLLENADGLIRIAEGRVVLEDLYGYLDGALVCVNGVLAPSATEDASPHNLHIEIADAKLQRTSAVYDQEGRIVGEFKFEGVGDVWAQLGPGREAEDHYAVHVADGFMSGFGAGEPWGDAHGWITIEGENQNIREFEARRAGGSLSISGIAPRRMGVDQPANIDLTAEDEDLERLLRQVVPGQWSNIHEALGLRGEGFIAAHFRPNEADGAPGRQIANIELNAAGMRPTPIPLELHDVKARLTLDAEGFELHQADARRGDRGVIQANGHGGWEAGRFWTDIGVIGRDLELDEELLAALPQALGAFLRRLAPSGRLQLTLDQILLNQPEADQVTVVGRMEIDEAGLQVGLPLTNYSGRLSGTCEVKPGGEVMFDAAFAVEKGILAKRSIANWEGRISSASEDRIIRIEDVNGEFCDGGLIGFAEIDPESQFELSFTLHDVSLNEFMNRKDDTRAAAGRLDGRIFVRGDIHDASKREGGGEIRIRGASLLSSPVTASVARVSRQKKGDIGHEVDEALLRFVWEGDELKFTRVDIQSRDLRFIGLGSWNMQTDAVKMTLLGAASEDAPRLFVLTDLLDSAREELLQYRVEGTAKDPRVTIEPLHNLTGPWRKLLGGE